MLVRRAGQALVAAASAALACWLAAHHPLSPALALAGVVVLAALTFAKPAHWPLWLLPLLPLVGLMTWTGWLIVEEMDIAVLAVAAGGWLRLAGGWVEGAPRTRSGAKLLLWLAPLLLSTLLSAWVGVADAGGLGAGALGWWQGYREPLNSLRLLKPVLEVLLLLPLWLAACRADERATGQHLVLALQALLLGVAVWVVWERLAFTGLANFSTDYRATGPFWEMHIGGAGLDAVLALTLPFAVAALATATTPLRWGGAALVLVLALYAALATFSRIVYAALPLGVALWWALRALHGGRGVAVRPMLAALPWLAGVAGLALWMFPSSGYRGLLALLGAVALLLPLGAHWRGLQGSHRVMAALGALAAMGGAAAVAAWVPKGAYVATAVAWALGAAALWAGRGAAAAGATLVASAAFGAALAGVVGVALHWGGAAALAPGLGAAAVLVVVALAASAWRQPLWPSHTRWQGQLLGGLVAVAAVVGVFSGGTYMGHRLAGSGEDGKGRQAHWAHALSMLHGSDWLWGKGLGRFWASQLLSDRADDHTGDYRLLPPGDGRDSAAVVLSSGRHELGWGEVFRLSQRLASPLHGPLVLRLDVRSPRMTKLEVEVCAKHLLYPEDCAAAQQHIEPKAGAWQAVELRLVGDPPTRGAWYAPRLLVFSIGLGRNLDRVEIDRLRLIDAAGNELLRNGDFEQGLAHWYFSSDRYHLPFHAKNLAVHLLFEQGLLGLGAWLLVLGAALWRTACGAARRHPLAPVLAGALVALWVVGLVDSILDMPRVAFLTLALLAVALALPAPRHARHPQAGPGLKNPPGP